MLPIPLLAPEYLHSASPNAPLTPYTSWSPNSPIHLLHPLGAPQCPLMPPIAFWPLSTYNPCQPQYTPDTPLQPPTPPDTHYTPLFSIVITLQLTIFMQLKCLFAIVISLQLTIFTSTSSLQYTVFSCQEYVFSSVKLSQFLQYLPNMHSKAPVAAQHWKTNKVVWT